MQTISTFLTEGQNWGKESLPMFNKIGVARKANDAALAEYCWKAENGNSAVWSASSGGFGIVRVVNSNGDKSDSNPFLRNAGAVPALLSSSKSSTIKPSKARLSLEFAEKDIKVLRVEKGVPVVTVGLERPQTIASEIIGKALDDALSKVELQPTNRQYTHNGAKRQEYVFFNPLTKQQETYILSTANPYNESYEFSVDGQKKKTGDAIWLKVEPIEYYQETEGKYKGTLVPVEILYSGVPFDAGKTSYDDRDNGFERTTICAYNNNFMQEARQVLNVQKSQSLSSLGDSRAGSNRGKKIAQGH